MLWALEQLCQTREYRANWASGGTGDVSKQLCRTREYSELIPCAIHLAEEAMKAHLQIVKNGINVGERQSNEEEALRMLRKLLQNRPTFECLIETERVQEVEKGLYQVSDLGRTELASLGAN